MVALAVASAARVSVAAMAVVMGETLGTVGSESARVEVAQVAARVAVAAAVETKEEEATLSH